MKECVQEGERSDDPGFPTGGDDTRVQFGTPRRTAKIMMGAASRGATRTSMSPAAVLSSTPFSEFAIVGIQESILKGEVSPAPCMQPVEAMEVVMGESPEEEAKPRELSRISEFCFPQGGRLDLAPATQINVWTGTHRDQTHVLQFTDEQGATSYGVCLTIYEARVDCPPSLIKALQAVRRKHAAARTLQYFVRRRVGLSSRSSKTLRRSKSSRSRSGSYSYSDTNSAIVRSKTSVVACQAAGSDLAGVIDEGKGARRGLLDHVRTGMRKLQQGGGWGTPRGDRQRTRSRAMRLEGQDWERSQLGREVSGDVDEYRRLVRATEALWGSAVVSTCRYGVSPTYKLYCQQEREEIDFVVVAPRCFCLISHQPNHPLLCKLLSTIVERERTQPQRENVLSALKRRRSCNALSLACSPSGSLCSSPTVAGTLMEKHAGEVASGGGVGAMGGAIYYAPDGGHCSGDDDLVSSRRRFLRYIQQDVVFPSTGILTLSFPPYAPSTTRLDLPLVPLQDWTVAVLFSHVSVDVIIKCVNLLLLEQSLVVIGEDQGLVSAISTAFVSLLQPFKWDGVFIPLLPTALSDILQSPVPFVLGVQPPFDPTRSTPHAAALHIGRCKEHLRLPDLTVKLPLCYQLLQALKQASKLFSCRRSRWANLHLATYMAGLTGDERQALASLRGIFHEYVQGLCGDLAYPGAWRKYGTFDSTSETFEFFPSWFLEPMRMMLEYQSAFVHTQMFSSYVDKRRIEDMQKSRQSQRCGAFLATFLAFRYRIRRLRRMSSFAVQVREDVGNFGGNEWMAEARESVAKESEASTDGVRYPFRGYVARPSPLRIEEEEH